MRILCFATQNLHKIKELELLMPECLQLRTLGQLGCNYELAEDQDSLDGNALQKATYIHNVYDVNCFADDTGLEVVALGGQPGVRSARYAGDDRKNDQNIDLLLGNMNGLMNRNARFRTCIALFWEGKLYEFEGICNGRIGHERMGNNGFGYDPVFIPETSGGLSFAQMDTNAKNKISHRAIAFNKLVAFIHTLDI